MTSVDTLRCCFDFIPLLFKALKSKLVSVGDPSFSD